MIKIHSKRPAGKAYFTPLVSFPSILALGFIVAALIVPFAVAYASGSFWLKNNSYREQPSVAVKTDILASFDGFQYVFSNGVYVQQSNQISYSSNPYAMQQLNNEPRSFSGQNNSIGILDYFWINATVPLKDSEIINQVRVVFTMQSRIRMTTEAMGYIDVSSPIPGMTVFTDGFLHLEQSNLFKDKVDYFYSDPVLNVNSFFSSDVDGISWPTVITNYLNRDLRTVYKYTPVWNYKATDSNKFNLAIKVRIPTWTVQYTPILMEILKDGWIQYLATFVFTGGILYILWDFIVTQQIIPTISYSELGSSKPKY